MLDARYVGEASSMDYGAQATTTQYHVIGDGVDRLTGSGAKDVYLIGAGVGSVTFGAQANSDDEIWLLDTLRSDLSTQVTVSASNAAVDAEFLLSLTTSGGDTLTLASALSTSGFNTPVRTIQFADGERVALSDLIVGQTLNFGATGQIQFGRADSSVDLAGTASADLLVGFGLNDRYLVGPGRGSDYVRDVSSSLHDRVVVSTTLSDVRFAASGVSGRDLTMTFLSTGEKVTVVGQLGAPGSEVDFFEFSNGLTMSAADVRAMVTTGTPGNDRLVGTVLNDVLDAKGGTDLALGGRGDDEYRFSLGYGQLSIDDTGAGNSIRFGAGIAPASLILTGDGNDLLISVSGTQDSIRLINARYGESIGQLFFADNTSTTLAALLSQAAAQAGTSANGIITGTEAAEDITGTSGNDRILGLGGVGNYLSGLAGNDTYVYGGGQDVIAESLSGFDTLEIPAGFKLEDMRMMRTGSSGTLKIWFENSDGGITLWNGFTSTGLPDTSVADDVERIVFADGRTIDLTQGEKTAGTSGNDYLYSFRNTGAVITPGAGNDIVNMTLLFQNNVVRYTTNDIGQDIIRLPEISESGSPSNAFSLQLQATPFDATVVLARNGVDLVVSFTNRTDSITVKDYFNPVQIRYGDNLLAMGGISFSNQTFTYASLAALLSPKTEGDDLQFGRVSLDGGAGNDILIGSGIANNYTFARGYGH
ncbi:MAG: hypothetical protein KGP14_14410, partial [Betaproteobacteria bacterium]|nr:hypothetical protein [Betaproteobacteria bacterium]